MRPGRRDPRPKATRYLEHRLFEMEKEGILESTGEVRDRQKVYRMTDAGRHAYTKLNTEFPNQNLDREFVKIFVQEAMREYLLGDGRGGV